MNVELFSDALGELDSRYIEEAIDYEKKTKRPVWTRWGAIAACLCLVAVIAGVALSSFEGRDAALPPTITIGDRGYVAPDMPVEGLPEGYHYLRDLTGKEANDTGLEGCAIYVDPQDEDMSMFYLYQECGTPVDEDTVDNSQRQWAYVRWIALD